MARKLRILSIVVLLLAVMLSACGGSQGEDVANNSVNTENVQNTNTVEENVPEVENTPAEDVEEPTEEPVVESTTIELEDATGTLVTLEGPAQRIVSLAPSTTEILFAIGAGDQVVGREDFANYPEVVLDLPSIGGTWGELNTEAILDLEPDLVLAAPLTTAEQIQSLTDVGLTVFQVPNPTDLDGMYDLLRTTATLTGYVEETEVLISSLQERVAAVAEVIVNAETTPLVFYELDSTDPSAPYTSGPNTFVDNLIILAGGQNLGADFEGEWVPISAEALIDLNPAIIILGDSKYGVTAEDAAARPGWDAISAVQNGFVYPIDDDTVSRPGPRLVDGLEEMAKLIHPELFE
ncbi:cobalamin-binding protein [bacterium]|nr:cobalamin-binding protein [bacterium]MCB2179072.1 cobalamin-binding protein [bacterium]